MFRIRLEFKTYKQFQTDFIVQDTHTLCASTHLLMRGIHTTQTSHCTLDFDSERDLTYGLLYLSDSPLYTVHRVDVESNEQ